MPGIVGHGHTPFECRAADRQVAQPAAHKRHHLVAPRVRTDEVWLCGIETEQLVLKRRELEEVVFFMNRLGGAPALRTGRAGADRIDVQLVVDAILSGVRALVDITIIANLPPKSLHTFLVPIRSGANVVVVGQAETIPYLADGGRD